MTYMVTLMVFKTDLLDLRLAVNKLYYTEYI